MLLGSDSGLEGGCGSSSSSRGLLGAPEAILGVLVDGAEDVGIVEGGEGGLEGILRRVLPTLGIGDGFPAGVLALVVIEIGGVVVSSENCFYNF